MPCCCCQLQAAGLEALQAGGTLTPGVGVVPSPFTGAPYSPPDITSSTVGDGSTSGVSSFDAQGFVNSLGSSISQVVRSIEGPQVTRLPNGQILLPSGQVVGNTPILGQGSSNMLLVVGVVLIGILIFSSMSKR